MPTAEDWIRILGLVPHPEGGYYRETYRSEESVIGAALPSRFAGSRSISTAIYYLLKRGQVSAFHRLASDEIWHHYAGSGITIFRLDPAGAASETRIGPDPVRGEMPQVVIPAGSWFAARPDGAEGYSLVGCTTAPGFEFDDLEVAEPGQLAGEYPPHRRWIEGLIP